MCSLKLGMLVETSLEKTIDITDPTTKATTQAKKRGDLQLQLSRLHTVNDPEQQDHSEEDVRQGNRNE